MAHETLIATPEPVLGLFDEPLWASIRERRLKLQRCLVCSTVQYPPAAVCTNCLADALEWQPVSGKAVIMSWVIFHKTYLEAYPAPYNVIAVRLDEGPIFVSNLEGREPDDNWIGRRVRLVYRDMPDGAVLPRFALSD